MPKVIDERLVRRAPESTEGLLELLFDGLEWPRPPHLEIEDIPLIGWSADELHLNPDAVARLTRIQQLPALTTEQQFGVFVLTFEGGRLPIGAIKRIVNKLVRKKRLVRSSSTHAMWDLEDLLFFCQSSDGVAALHVVAFQERDNKPVLKVISWSANAPDNRIGLVAESALPALSWPTDEVDLRQWQRGWLQGFTGHREGIRTARRLARRMAEVARDVRDGVAELYEVENEEGPLRTLARELRTNLLDDLTPDSFADMFAETMVYGLLTARITHPDEFAADALSTAFRFDNPFLESVYERFKEQSADNVDIDELGLAELADVLADANIAEVLADFGSEGRRDDPVVHFYEDFLADYNPDKRVELGVYYTPKPVVQYIIRSVDEILKRDFGLPLGIADPTTWAQLAERYEDLEIPEGADPDRPFVSMLDPCTGTGTFLVEWLEHAEENVRAVARARGATSQELDEIWEQALVENVLPNMAAFEITMASYAVAHLKVSLTLPERLRGQFRLPIYLTNTLRPPKSAEGVLDFDGDPLSEERRLADQVKDERPVTVIVGNPPYLERARGQGGMVEEADTGTGRTPSLDLFREPGAGREEFNLHNLNVYFWRWATWKALVHSGSAGVVGFITTSPYLSSPAFKGMRRWVRENVSIAYVVDCTPEGHQPNVPTRLFPGVQQPLAIMTLAADPSIRSRKGEIKYRRIEGTQQQKFLELGSIHQQTGWANAPDRPTGPFLAEGSEVWQSAPRLEDLMPFKSTAVTANRAWPSAPHPDVLKARWQKLADADDQEAAELLVETSDRTLRRQVKPLPGHPQLPPLSEDRAVCPSPVEIGWRSFDTHWVLPDNRVLDRPRPKLWSVTGPTQVFVMELHSEPLRVGPALVFSASVPASSYVKGSGGGRTYPLWTDSDASSANVAPGLLDSWAEILGTSVSASEFALYLAGVSGFPSFQHRFASDLTTPGIRIPLTGSDSRFEVACQFGEVALAANTRGRRGDRSVADKLRGATRIDEPRILNRVSTSPEELPATFSYDDESQTLCIGVGRFGPVHPDVMAFTTSGMNVFRKWFGYRKRNPAGRTSEGLNAINAARWYDEWTDDLIAMLRDLTLLVELTPPHAQFLDELVSGPLISADELGL